MMTVIADDFTGAAEIAGLGLRYGLDVEIEPHVLSRSETDLLIIATDTRSMKPEDAYDEVYSITKQLIKYGRGITFKKADSVFRGNIYKELWAIVNADVYDKVLLVPANPSRGRVLKDGIYYINNRYLHETSFADDPDYPITTSNVLDLINADGRNNVQVLAPGQKIINQGILIGEALYEQDLKDWAFKIDNKILPAGGAEFFKALLDIKGYEKVIAKTEKTIEFGKNILIVCGSAHSKGKAGFKDIRHSALKIIPMPDSVFYNGSDAEQVFKKWEEKAVQAFHEHTVVIIEIDQQVVRDENYPVRLRNEMARLVHAVLQRVDVNELLIDGGATVYAIMEKAGFEKLFPVQELSPGVIRMCVQSRRHFFITIKPGSYSWPALLLSYLGVE